MYKPRHNDTVERALHLGVSGSVCSAVGHAWSDAWQRNKNLVTGPAVKMRFHLGYPTVDFEDVLSGNRHPSLDKFLMEFV